MGHILEMEIRPNNGGAKDMRRKKMNQREMKSQGIDRRPTD